MTGDPWLERLGDAELKRRIDAVVARHRGGVPLEGEPAFLQLVAALRDEAMRRLGDEPGAGSGFGGVREPRRPRPGGGAAGAVVDPFEP